MVVHFSGLLIPFFAASYPELKLLYFLIIHSAVALKEE